MPNLNDCPKGFLCYGPCNPNIACIGATGQAHCRGCVPGYKGINCTEDMDECSGMKSIFEPRHEKNLHVAYMHAKTKAQISNCAADHRLCFRYTNSIIALLS